LRHAEFVDGAAADGKRQAARIFGEQMRGVRNFAVRRNFLRARHVHGDGQIARLYDMTRSFATSYDDMAFTSSRLATITARTLIVHGDRDPLYPVELAVELLRGIPASALWVIPNGGHGPIFGERAALFRSEALAFLAAGNKPGTVRPPGRADVGTA